MGSSRRRLAVNGSSSGRTGDGYSSLSAKGWRGVLQKGSCLPCSLPHAAAGQALQQGMALEATWYGALEHEYSGCCAA